MTRADAPELRALIWDVDGTLAETERDGHRVAFNCAFEAEGLAWRWDVETYGELLKVAGGMERLIHDMGGRPDAPASDVARADLARVLHRRKNRCYAEMLDAQPIALRPGVLRMMDECGMSGIDQAIATTTSRGNLVALLDASMAGDWRSRFVALVCAEDAPRKKPDPQAYRNALDALGLDAPHAIAVEDSPNGLAAAHAAGIATLITRSVYFRNERFDGAAAICDDLDSRVVWQGGEAAHVDVAALRALLDARRLMTPTAASASLQRTN
ncbi:MAG: HAD-IA family hydrolase [Burkholderiaceae bacterium]